MGAVVVKVVGTNVGGKYVGEEVGSFVGVVVGTNVGGKDVGKEVGSFVEDPPEYDEV